MLSKLGSLMVATTSPMTLATCMMLLGDVDGIDDADDRGIDRRVLHARRHARRAAADNQNGLADAGIDRIDRNEVVAFGLALGIDRTGQQQLVADQPRIFSRRDEKRSARSEEHTSELQSLRHLVCRLLLEKKKKINKHKHTNI